MCWCWTCSCARAQAWRCWAQLPGELAGRKVYVLTNHATADLREACVRLGADAVFDKSTELDEFFAAFLA